MPETDTTQGAVPRIVMIDDEVSNLQIVKIVVTRENVLADLVLFEDPRSALDYLDNNSADLILLDLAMPAMDGFEVMARLKDNPVTAEIPVIFLSAHQETQYILKAFDMGATDFIGKPIMSPILIARIRQIIQTRTLQKQLQRSNEHLIETNRFKDELISICSHDLRAPLNAIELVCQFLNDTIEGKSEQSQAELIGRILGQSRLARRLVENLLGLDRIQEGRLIPTASFFLVDELLEQCGEDEQATLQSRGLKFSLDLSGDGMVGFGDREMLAQVVHNLLNNALRHACSSITCQTSLLSYSDESGGRLLIQVSDDGPGIPEDQQESIFRKYTRLDRQGGGSGLGLYISRQMVELHQGQIRVRSAPGEGTVFEVELPNVFRPDHLPPLSEFYDETIVVAAAAGTQGEMLEGILSEGGLINLVQAPTPDHLRKTLFEEKPGLVLVDLDSPELVAYLKDQGRTHRPGTSWILLGSFQQAQRLEDRLPGPNTLLEPPFNPLLFLQAVINTFKANGTKIALPGV